MTRYPSTADLRHLRESFAREAGSFPPFPHPDTPRRWQTHIGAGVMSRYTDPTARPVSGAWQDERDHGIGFRSHGIAGWNADPWASRSTEARYAMALAREHAYARAVDRADGSPARPYLPRNFRPDVMPLAWSEELLVGAPYTFRDADYRGTHSTDDDWQRDHA